MNDGTKKDGVEDGADDRAEYLSKMREEIRKLKIENAELEK